MKTKNFRLKLGLFLNYLVHGCGLIILTQNLDSLAKNWHSTLATASFILSGLGIGRILAYLIMGYISDKFSRKLTLMIGMFTYLIFFVVTPLNHSLVIAYGLAILAGIANSALDSATYPLFTELGSKSSSDNILIKAFMSVGEFSLPLLIIFLNAHQLWFGLSFLFPTVFLVFNIFNIITLKFPNVKKTEQVQSKSSVKLNKFSKTLVTAALLVYGYTSMGIMIWFTQWITIFAKKIQFSDWVSHFLLSAYSVGSIVGVITTFLVMRHFNVRNGWFLLSNLIGTVALIIVIISRIPAISMVASIVFGFSVAGGLMQIALNILLSIFPKHKGIFTAIYFIFGSIASFTVPIITGKFIGLGTQNILDGDVIMGLLGIISAIIVFLLFPKTSSLNQARLEINSIDNRLTKLLNKRFATVHFVGQLKKQQHLATEDKGREAQVLKGIGKMSKPQAISPYNQAIVQNIMNNSKKYEDFLKKNKNNK
ncbi:MFS transporter [Acetilactobacillus jinshanensis]|uniref:MFS transporter n=1 Tax=Acetilactobacillus jinshanensis TaxID=1720083 RepID=A0A4P6ZKL1_9LACO|nr:MFS transporter [Acetilactobacillus jinshanensis]QBP18315.1 MFS transporter [Acetilactobacillus jinshanensis]URL61180.1 MFS transporter [uncultured bacterium]